MTEAKRSSPAASLGKHLSSVEATLSELAEARVIERIWSKDHTVWKPEPKEITDRLGWLSVMETMSKEVSSLESFAAETRDSEYRHVVLLGMGGSSLGPEVIRQTLLDDNRLESFEASKRYPRLIVLDSTVPGWLLEVTNAIDPARTLFLVSSKSGGTVEPLSFYSHFRNLVENALGKERAGDNFVAVTDPGTSLEGLAREKGFRRVFSNPPDIGGRYSVLSYFGLVPAGLAGIDVSVLLDRAEEMKRACASYERVGENPGAWLGAVMGTLASNGVDKLTIVTSPALGSFGLWVEQLLAESTGKEGTGIIPVAREPLMDPESYGDDRLFVYLRLDGDGNSGVDDAVENIKSSGRPLVSIALRDRNDLAAEFYRWEFATSVAGAVMGIHPFDQPDVQGAKDATDRVLEEYRASSRLPEVDARIPLNEMVSSAKAGDYLAILAYLVQTPGVDEAVQHLRRRVTESYGVATTFGYGPRYLHSTGQLHKGGPGTGLFLQLTSDHVQNVEIPGKDYTFAVLADAQATGDLQALQALGRRVTRIHLGAGIEAAIRGLAGELK